MIRYLNVLQAARFLVDGFGPDLKMPVIEGVSQPGLATMTQALIDLAKNGEIEPTGCKNGGPRKPIPRHFWIDAGIDVHGPNGGSAHRRENAISPARSHQVNWSGLRFDAAELENVLDGRTGKRGARKGTGRRDDTEELKKIELFAEHQPQNAPDQTALTAGAETECREWLLQLMLTPKTKPKIEYREDAIINKYSGLSKKAFDRAWGVAASQSGAHPSWTKTGPVSIQGS